MRTKLDWDGVREDQRIFTVLARLRLVRTGGGIEVENLQPVGAVPRRQLNSTGLSVPKLAIETDREQD